MFIHSFVYFIFIFVLQVNRKHQKCHVKYALCLFIHSFVYFIFIFVLQVDYNNEKIFNTILMIPGVTMPLVCLLALEDDTFILMYRADGSFDTVNIPKGHLLIMSGDCLHGGFSHVTTNARLHWYLEAIDLQTSDNNETGWMNYEMESGIFKWVMSISFWKHKREEGLKQFDSDHE